MSDLTAWFLSIGSFAAIVLLTAFAAKSLAGDPPRGRRRCPRCWHELGPLPEGGDDDDARRARRCGECGFEAAREADCVRTRRSIARAAVAVAGILAIVVAARIRTLEQGPWSLLPTRVLLVASPHLGNGGYRSLQAELAKRIALGELDDAQLAAAVDLVVRGDADARPSDDIWLGKYEPMCSALIGVIPRGSPLLMRLLEIPPRMLVTFLSARPGRPSLVVIDDITVWPDGVEAKATVTFADGSTRRVRFNPESRANSLVLEIPPTAAPRAPIDMVVSVRPRGTEAGAPWIDYPLRGLTGPEIAGCEPDDPPAAPVDSPEIRAALASVFADDTMLALWESGHPIGGLSFNVAAAQSGEFERTLFGVRVEVLENGVVRRTSRIWWCAGVGNARTRWMTPIEDREALARLWAQDPAKDADWTLRVSGDAELADYARPPVAEQPARAAFKHWSGAFEVPLKVRRMPGAAPARRWTIESEPSPPR